MKGREEFVSHSHLAQTNRLYFSFYFFYFALFVLYISFLYGVNFYMMKSIASSHVEQSAF